MMNTSNSFLTTSWIWLHVHWVFWAIALIALVGAIIWMAKYSSKKELLKLIWITAIIGILGGLITIPASIAGWQNMMSHDSSNIGQMSQHMMDDLKSIQVKGGSPEDMRSEMLEHMEEMMEHNNN